MPAIHITLNEVMLLAVAGILLTILLLVIYVVARAISDYFEDEDKED